MIKRTLFVSYAAVWPIAKPLLCLAYLGYKVPGRKCGRTNCVLTYVCPCAVQAVSSSQCNQTGTVVALQLQLFLLLRVGPPGSAVRQDRVALPHPGHQTVWHGPRLQHRHLQWNDTSFQRSLLPVCSQPLRLLLHDSGWASCCFCSIYHFCIIKNMA